MTTVGRNDPCPCGSGLKFKRCCLKKAQGPAEWYGSEERHSVTAKLLSFAARPEFKESWRLGFEEFWGDWLEREGRDEEGVRRVMGSEQAEIAFNSWFAFDFDLDRGMTMSDRFLAQEGNKLTRGERKYLEDMRGSHLRLYEIVEMKEEEGFGVRDLWNDELLWVWERLGTRQLVRWDIVAGRIGWRAKGERIFETLPHCYPAAVKDELLSMVRKAHQRFQRKFPEKSIADFFKSMAPVFNQVWLDSVVFRPMPKIVTTDGEPFVFARVIFDVLNRNAAADTLEHLDDLVDQGDGHYAWVETTGARERTLGSIVMKARRLVLETNSQSRAERGKEFLRRSLGDAVRFRAISYEDVGQAIKRAPRKAEKEASDVPAEEQRRILGEFYEQHYRKWLDEPIPALGNRTPRHAARLKTVRPKLIALLKDFESRNERHRRAGEPAYDFSQIWKELGLTRE